MQYIRKLLSFIGWILKYTLRAVISLGRWIGGLFSKNDSDFKGGSTGSRIEEKSGSPKRGTEKPAKKVTASSLLSEAIPEFNDISIDSVYHYKGTEGVINDCPSFCFLEVNKEKGQKERYYLNLVEQLSFPALERPFYEQYTDDKYQLASFQQELRLPLIRLQVKDQVISSSLTESKDIIFDKLKNSLNKKGVFTLNVTAGNNSAHAVYISGYVEDRKLHLQCFNQTASKTKEGNWDQEYLEIMQQVAAHFKDYECINHGIMYGAFPSEEKAGASCMETGFFLYSAANHESKEENIACMKDLFTHAKDIVIDLKAQVAIRYKVLQEYNHQVLIPFYGAVANYAEEEPENLKNCVKDGLLPIESTAPFKDIWGSFKNREKYVIPLQHPRNKR